MQFGKLLGTSWNKAATVQNAVSAFRASGIAPFNPGEILDYAVLSNEAVEQLNSRTSVESLAGLVQPNTSAGTSNENLQPSVSV
ncbi:hypothetical protein QE152_g36735 [Popillia japonica]|uniref:Uncharacterized protein n=1 Tax=Popillia japonica TaxID=7064 RepID=A0AAW1ICK1_POPJA